MEYNKNIEEFNSDFFDNASYEWRKNKILLCEGTFRYRCCFTNIKDERCNKMRVNQGYSASLILNQGYSASLIHTNKAYFCSKHLRTKFDPEIHKFEN